LVNFLTPFGSITLGVETLFELIQRIKKSEYLLGRTIHERVSTQWTYAILSKDQ
jgi:hypothetical protein